MKTASFILFLWLTVSAFSQAMTVTNMTVTSVTTAASLASTLTSTITTLNAKTNSGAYSTLTVATNTQVWTWPVNLSCVGVCQNGGYQSVLIGRNAVLSNNHFGGVGTSFTMTDTNGVQFTIPVSATYGTNDLQIAILVSNAPASVLIPGILPSNYTNFLFGHTNLIRKYAFWLHKNSSAIELVTVGNQYPASNDATYGTTMSFATTGGIHGGSYPSGGDSGSPVFFVIGNTPVLAYTMTTAGGAGCFVSSDPYYGFIISKVGLANLSVLDMTNTYPSF